MKKLSFLFVVLLLVSSCSKDNSEPISINSLNRKNLILERIKSLGFDTTTIVEYNDYFLVEGDIRIPKKENKLKQASTTNQISYIFSRNINIYLDNNFTSGSELISDALDEVISAYNGIGCQLYFSRTLSSNDADITITNEYLNGSCGQGGFPDENGNPAATVRIDENTALANANSVSQMKFLLAHELGHNIGLRHTNWWKSFNNHSAESQYPDGANQIPGTPQEDESSIMNAVTCGYFWPQGGFPFYDVQAIKYLFPRPTIIGNADLTNIIRAGESYTYYYSGKGNGPFSWSINNAQAGYYWELPPTNNSVVLFTIYDRTLVDGETEINNLDVELASGQTAHLEITVRDGYRLYTSRTLPLE